MGFGLGLGPGLGLELHYEVDHPLDARQHDLVRDRVKVRARVRIGISARARVRVRVRAQQAMRGLRTCTILPEGSGYCRVKLRGSVRPHESSPVRSGSP